MTPATFYIVNGPRGVYYAVRNHHTGMVWTERTELAAQQQAQDEGLALIESQSINHSQLLNLMMAQPQPARVEGTPATPDESTRHIHHGGLSGFLNRFRRHPKEADRSHS